MPRAAAKTRETYARDEFDWYVEPVWSTDLLLDAERFDGSVWDPAAGIGNVVAAFRARGLDCKASDLIDRTGDTARIDFLRPDLPLDQVDNIVTNPPYGGARLTTAFITRALLVARRKVAVIVNEKYLYAQARHDLFAQVWPLARVYHLSTRPSMPPGHLLRDGKVKAAGGTSNYCWLVFLRGHQGAPTTHWLRRQVAA